MKASKPLYKILLSCLLFTSFTDVFAEYKIKIRGKVTELASQKPLRNVNIASQGNLLGLTDRDGNFSIQASPDADLLFNIPGYNDVTVKIDNRQIINIQMSEREIEIQEVVIIGKEQNKKISAEPTDLEVKGNYFHLKTKFRVPARIFKTDKRFIIQPSLYNANLKSYSYFRPVVIDGAHFSINNLRLNAFDLSNDSLNRYTVTNNLKTNEYIYAYYDSIYVSPQKINHDFKAECYLAVNGFTEHPKDYLDTVVIARGTKNTLRFISYGFAPYEIKDSAYYPKPEMNLMSEKGISNIRFPIGQATIDRKDSINQVELTKIAQTIRQILQNEEATIRSISAIGYTSPDGSYERNKQLARKRTDAVLGYIEEIIPASNKKFIKLFADSEVESWQRVAEMALEDSASVGEEIQSIVNRYKNDYANCHHSIRRLPVYQSYIATSLLPRMRRTKYIIDYSVFRNLKDPEIWERYQNSGSKLTRYEYWRLSDTAEKEELQNEVDKQALEVYPDFLLLANKYAIHLIERDSFDTSVLRASIDSDAPWEIKYNQAIMALGTHEYQLADSLCSSLPEIEEIAYLKAIIAALNGRYNEAYPLIVSKGGLNEVLILLCMDRNKDAEQKITALLDLPENSDNAHMWYIRAVCANRTDNLTIAMESLRRALLLKPDLKETAKLDSDIMDILELVDY